MPLSSEPVSGVNGHTASTHDRLKRLVLALTATLLTFLLAALIGGGIWLWLRFYGSPFAQTYPVAVAFTDAKGVEAGDAVQMAGVRIGSVERVGIRDTRAEVHLRISHEVIIPRGSRFIARADLFSIPGGIEVIAGSSTGGEIRQDETGLVGESGPDLSDSFHRMNGIADQFARVGERSETLLVEATRTTHNARAAITDPAVQRDLRETLAGVRTATKGGANITRQITQMLDATAPRSREVADSAARMTHAAADLTVEMRTLARTSRPQVAALLGDTRRATAAAAEATERGAALLPPPSPATATQTAKVLSDLSATVGDLRATAARVDAIAANGQTVLADPAVAADLRQTVRSLRAVSEQAERASKNAEPLLTDPTLPTEVRDTVRQIHEISVTTRTLLDTLSQLVQKAQGGGGGPLGTLFGKDTGQGNEKENKGNGGQARPGSP